MAAQVRTRTSFRLHPYLLDGLKNEAKKGKVSVNSLVESLLMDALYSRPNHETLAAMSEVLEKKDSLEEVDVDNFEDYVRSL